MTRALREGDVVRTLNGTSKGRVGRVVGHRYGQALTNKSVVVQWKNKSGTIREAFEPTDLELVAETPNPEVKEPLPAIANVLAETVAPYVITCGRYLCLPQRDGTVLTLVPEYDGKPLKESYEIMLKSPLGRQGALDMVLRHSFVTRQPHLVESGMSRKIDEAMRMSGDPAAIVKELLG